MAWHTHGPKLDASDLKLMCTAYVLYLNYSCCSLQLEELQLRLPRLEPKPGATKSSQMSTGRLANVVPSKL